MSPNGTVREVIDVISSWRGPVVVAYSGGKDSSAVLKLIFSAAVLAPEIAKKITVVYCDTQVENPVLDEFVKLTLRALRREAKSLAPKLMIRILRPALKQRYFVRVIGRGYPPPTTFFRWCTKDLRIRPVQKFVGGLGERPLVVVGTREGESAQRDRVLNRVGGISGPKPVIHRQADGGAETNLYLPIAKYSLEDVWECLAGMSIPKSIDVHRLAQVYKHGGGECPVIRETNDKPCASARFGCWVCTVVRRDRSAESLLGAGYDHLRPFYEFRNWISEIRNDVSLRCGRRRNGQKAPGPFKLKTRQMILRRVRELEKKVDRKLISKLEEREIRRLWTLDRKSPDYRDLEASTI